MTTDTPMTDRASHLCHPWTLPTDHEALSKFRLLANEMAKLERELAETKRLLVEAREEGRIVGLREAAEICKDSPAHATGFYFAILIEEAITRAICECVAKLP
jgi:hypothetical protein